MTDNKIMTDDELKEIVAEERGIPVENVMIVYDDGNVVKLVDKTKMKSKNPFDRGYSVLCREKGKFPPIHADM